MQKVEALFVNHFINRIGHKALFGLAMLLCLAWGTVDAMRPTVDVTAQTSGTEWPREWPREWDGEPLRPLALGEVEQRFARRFPGAIARMTDGRRMFVLRQVERPTRMLHPAADCYRALGWRIEQARLERDAQQRLWRCFDTLRTGSASLRVCERIVDAKGQAFTDTSAWYWAAASGQSQGPWQAVTMASVPSH